jgi:5-methylcytosine-specific restriction endonuclease McrA
MADEIITRKEARAQGCKRYFTGKACKHGHLSERTVSSGGCVVCRDEWHARHPGRMQEHRAKWAAANPRDATEYWRRWTQKNPERQKAASKRWHDAHPGRMLERTRRWARLNPGKILLKTQRRRARLAKAPGSYTLADLAVLLKAQKGRCAYCRSKISAGKHLDHIRPLSAGGSNGRDNLQFLCAPCNLAKGAKDPLQFAQESGRLL